MGDDPGPQAEKRPACTSSGLFQTGGAIPAILSPLLATSLFGILIEGCCFSAFFFNSGKDIHNIKSMVLARGKCTIQ